MLLVFVACENPSNNNANEDRWPNTRGYTRIAPSGSQGTATTERITVSPGQRFYSSSTFASMRGDSQFFEITPSYDSKITIDFKRLTFGTLRIYRNGTRVSIIWPSTTTLPNPISITAGDILLFEANPERRWTTQGPSWMVGFSVVAE